MELTEFWISIKDEYPLLSDKAQQILIPFSTSYLCEAGFSAVAVIKSKYRAKINVEKEMRVAMSNLIPQFHDLRKCAVTCRLIHHINFNVMFKVNKGEK
jgi:hypothetical protein